MNVKKVLIWAVIIAFSGFLFGLNTAVISGAEQKIQDLWQLSVFEHRFTVCIALVGSVAGAMLAGITADKFGRRKTLFWIAVLFLISAIGTALAIDWYTFLLFRFVGGLAVGCSSVTAPMYISELSTGSYRGRLVYIFQLNIVLGILFAVLSNYLLQDVGENAWRWMLGIQAFPASVFLILVLELPESPRWLIVKKNCLEEGKEILMAINPITADSDMWVIENSRSSSHDISSDKLFSKKYGLPVTLVTVFAVFNQLSGMNAVIYYAPRIFEMSGVAKSSTLRSSVGLGVIHLAFTLLAINFIDRYGRRTLMLISSFGQLVMLGLVSGAFYSQSFSGYSVLLCLFCCMVFFAFSQGLIWVFISEIFPNEVRAKGMALGGFAYWLMAIGIAFTFPYLTEKLGGGNSFMMFTVIMFFQLLFVWRVMPETRGTSLEQTKTGEIKSGVKVSVVKTA
jgi:SP family arabinose:H+ symporter-like MFS transporter